MATKITWAELLSIGLGYQCPSCCGCNEEDKNNLVVSELDTRHINDEHGEPRTIKLCPNFKQLE